MSKNLAIIVCALLVGTAGVAAKNEKVNSEKKMETKVPVDYRQIPFKTIDGTPSNLAAYKDKVLLIVNVASECGNTPQYAGLEELYEKYKDKGLVVIGFPANNFGEQEPGTNEEIKKFCSTNYHVTFPMMSKVSVLGEDKHPLFAYLTEKSGQPGEIKWNFAKFLLDKQGKLIARFPPKLEPLSKEIVTEVETLLK